MKTFELNGVIRQDYGKKAAKADLWPKFYLTGSIGTESLDWGGLFKGITGENPDASGMWDFLGTPCPASAQSLTHLASALSCGHSCLYLMKVRVRDKKG